MYLVIRQKGGCRSEELTEKIVWNEKGTNTSSPRHAPKVSQSTASNRSQNFIWQQFWSNSALLCLLHQFNLMVNFFVKVRVDRGGVLTNKHVMSTFFSLKKGKYLIIFLRIMHMHLPPHIHQCPMIALQYEESRQVD